MQPAAYVVHELCTRLKKQFAEVLCTSAMHEQFACLDHLIRAITGWMLLRVVMSAWIEVARPTSVPQPLPHLYLKNWAKATKKLEKNKKTRSLFFFCSFTHFMGPSRVWRGCFGAKNQVLFEMEPALLVKLSFVDLSPGPCIQKQKLKSNR